MSKGVTIIGCGLMGTAIAGAYLRSGYDVTVWNRSAEKCKALVSLGAVQAPSFRDALIAHPLVISVLVDYEAFRGLLETTDGDLARRDIINLASGVPAEAQAMADYVSRLGGRYLDGAIASYPDEIGGAKTIIYYGGEAAVWDCHCDDLKVAAGSSRWLGANVSAPNVMDAAMTGGFFITSIGAFLEAAHFAVKAGIPLHELTSSVDYFLGLMGREIKSAIEQSTSGDFSTDQAVLSTYVGAMKSWRQAMIDSGVYPHMLSANLHAMERAVAAGHGESSLAALFAAPKNN